MERYVYIWHLLLIFGNQSSIPRLSLSLTGFFRSGVKHIMFTIPLSQIPRFTSGKDIELFWLGSIVSSKKANTFARDNNSEQNLVILDHKPEKSWKTTLSFWELKRRGRNSVWVTVSRKIRVLMIRISCYRMYHKLSVWTMKYFLTKQVNAKQRTFLQRMCW